MAAGGVGKGALDSQDLSSRLKPSSTVKLVVNVSGLPVTAAERAICVQASTPRAVRCGAPEVARAADRVPCERLGFEVVRSDDPLVEARALLSILRRAGCGAVDRIVETVGRLYVRPESFRVLIFDTCRT